MHRVGEARGQQRGVEYGAQTTVGVADERAQHVEGDGGGLGALDHEVELLLVVRPHPLETELAGLGIVEPAAGTTMDRFHQVCVGASADGGVCRGESGHAGHWGRR